MTAEQKFEEAAKDIRKAVEELHEVLNEMQDRGMNFTRDDWKYVQENMRQLYQAIGFLKPLARGVVLTLYASLSARLPRFSPDRLAS